MFTQCPHCNTIFSVSPEQLKIAGGTVRCGLCQELFQADKHLVLQQARKGKTGFTRANDKSHSTADTAHSQQELQSEDLSALLLEEEHPEIHRQRVLIFFILSTICAFALIIQIGLLVNHNWLPEKLQTGLCTVFHCKSTEVQRDVHAIEVVSRGVYSHPGREDALMVNATIVNRATFAQPYPKIGLILLDIHGDPVAGRQFEPAQYLTQAYQPSDQIESNQSVVVNVEIIDPGKQVIGYEFSFF